MLSGGQGRYLAWYTHTHTSFFLFKIAQATQLIAFQNTVDNFSTKSCNLRGFFSTLQIAIPFAIFIISDTWQENKLLETLLHEKSTFVLSESLPSFLRYGFVFWSSKLNWCLFQGWFRIYTQTMSQETFFFSAGATEAAVVVGELWLPARSTGGRTKQSKASRERRTEGLDRQHFHPCSGWCGVVRRAPMVFSGDSASSR